MRMLVLSAAMLLLASGLFSASAQAAGCLKGAVVGGVAGHYVGHHGLIGAGIGCAIGRHEANKRVRQENRSARYGYGY